MPAKAALLALLALAAQAPPAVAPKSGEERVYAAIVEIEPGEGEYVGYYCPPDMGENDICNGASILIQRGQIERFFEDRPKADDPDMRRARKSDVDGSFVRLKMIGGHAMRRMPPGRYMAVLEPTDEDYVFVQWYESVRDTGNCFPAHVMDHYKSRISVETLRLKEDGRRCF